MSRQIQFVILTIVLQLINSQDQQQTISIVFIHEIEQKDVQRDVSLIFKGIETNFGNQISLADRWIAYDRQHSDDSYDSLCQVLNAGVTTIVDFTYSPWSELKELSAAWRIPHYHVDTTLSSYVTALATFLKEKNAIDAALIFQSEKDQTESLYRLVQGSTLRTVTYNGMTYENAERIKKLRPVPSYYGVFATSENMDDFFEKIEHFNLIRSPDKWNLIFLDFMTTTFESHGKYPALTTLIPNNAMCCKLTSANADCKCTEKSSITKLVLTNFINNLVASLNEHDVPLRNIKCADEPSPDDAATQNDLLDKMSESLRTIESFSMTDNDFKFYLNMSVTAEDTENPGELIQLGTVDDHQFVASSPQVIKSSKRFFRVGITEAIPWTYMKTDPKTGETMIDETGNPIWEGYCIDMIEKLAEDLDFDYELVVPKKGTFGKRIAFNKWDGLVGDLMTGETDIAAAALKMTAEREEVIDFIAPYYEQTGISIVIRNPVRQTSLFKFMTVLRLEVWLSIIVALVATAIMIWLLDKYSPYSAKNNKDAYPYQCREFTLKESFWFALTSFTPQGGGEAPKALSGRTMVASYWLFVVLMLATFTANLAAFLTVERMQTPVQSLDQLARQSRINYTVVSESDTHKYFINMKFAEDTLYRVWKEITLNSTNDQAQYRVWDYPIREQYGHILLAINSSNPVRDAAEGFRKVNEHENADFAFIHDTAEIRYEISRNCNLTEVGEPFAEQPYALGIQQGSYLQDELSRRILNLQKERFFEFLSAKYWNQSARGQCENTDDNEGITLESLGGVFIATSFGLALALVTLIGEVIYYRRKENTTTSSEVLLVKAAKTDDDDPPPTFEDVAGAATENQPKNQKIPKTITIGTEFVKASENPNVSYISVFPNQQMQRLRNRFE
ncbi:uncharacterized protein LOC119069934 isoform X1 [Bradysia coprophila]|uniref:uncharacterized protein LOC119069934 isoform X1 n=1 Tax=Bradysia coprophila TaxID=38358 RepID=UPI00187DD035|nr:uncharacterized protein LOC119069934 isoform X1 [Bradysia coprophila]